MSKRRETHYDERRWHTETKIKNTVKLGKITSNLHHYPEILKKWKQSKLTTKIGTRRLSPHFSHYFPYLPLFSLPFSSLPELQPPEAEKFGNTPQILKNKVLGNFPGDWEGRNNIRFEYGFDRFAAASREDSELQPLESGKIRNYAPNTKQKRFSVIFQNT